MARIFRQPSSIKLPQQNRDAKHEQYGRELGGIIECPDCHAVHYRKRWYASRQDLTHLKKDKSKIAKKHLCPACTMIHEHEFEGELLVEKVPVQYRENLINLIKNYGSRERRKDAQHRIIGIEEIKNGYRVTTSENQLVDRLAKKIKEVLNSVDVHISHSREPYEVDRVRVIFRGVS